MSTVMIDGSFNGREISLNSVNEVSKVFFKNKRKQINQTKLLDEFLLLHVENLMGKIDACIKTGVGNFIFENRLTGGVEITVRLNNETIAIIEPVLSFTLCDDNDGEDTIVDSLQFFYDSKTYYLNGSMWDINGKSITTGSWDIKEILYTVNTDYKFNDKHLYGVKNDIPQTIDEWVSGQFNN